MLNDGATDWVELLSTPLDIARATQFVTAPRAGGINIFLGTTRAETSPQGQELLALEYQAYESMALKQLHELAKNCRAKWPFIKLVILHRVGRVLVGQPSVLIAVSAPHRAESFDACRWIIDELKKQVTIWKQEVWADGATSWVNPNTAP